MYEVSFKLIRLCVRSHITRRKESLALYKSFNDTPTKRQVSKCQVSKRPVSKRLKRQVYKTSGLQNVRFTKRHVFKTSVRKKHPYIFCTCGWWKSAGFVAAMFAGCVLNCKYVYFILTFTFPFTKAYTHGVDRYSGRNHLRWRIIYISING